ncbi:hypothetical protein [Dokdonella sp.]|uniref:hypothetical protein n=1 Tax=Dokdonella sp. TaxID=2291710 RepID=UPI0037849F00
MQNPATQALTFWLIAAALILLGLFSVLGAPRTPDGAGEAVGRVLAQTGVAALLAWWLARRRNAPWSWLQFGAVHGIAVVAVGLLTVTGRARADDAFPFTAAFAQDWTVERLAGVSSAPQDQAAGVRQRARWNGADGAAVIEITCSWRQPDDHPDVGAQLRGVAKGMSDGLSKQGITLDQDAIRTVRKGHRDWLQIDLRAHDASGPRLVQTVAMTSTPRCLATATLSGTPQAHAQQAAYFSSVLDHLHFQEPAPPPSTRD